MGSFSMSGNGSLSMPLLGNSSLLPGNGSQCGAIAVSVTESLLPPVYVCVFAVGAVGNAVALRGALRGWSRRGRGGQDRRGGLSFGVFVLNLALADLLYLCTLPFLVHYYAGGSRWIYGQTFCKLTRFCFNLNLYGSIGFLTCISVYRYLGIVHPLRVLGKIRTRHSLAVTVLVWILVIIQILPDMFFDKNDSNSPESCYDTTSDGQVEAYLPYSVGWSVTGFVVPLLIILVCYGHIVVVLVQRAQVDVELKQRCLRLVVVLLILFSVCFIPYHVFRNVNLTTRLLKLKGRCHAGFKDVYLLHQVGRCLACLNSAINPLIYVVGSDDFLVKLQNCRRSVCRKDRHALKAPVESPTDPEGP
ncbi:P2Y purinoceptor 1-like [Cololabis saira]|uniref:P2Y purinoceptor 1-like n=1 Tax=Cololabis saira TaxID=129043 RepID=UPI002AD23D34|nr:P2Y purinoceptor 1-like [Cololabis saira]